MSHTEHHLWELRIATGQLMCIGCEKTPEVGVLVGRTQCGDGWYCPPCMVTLVRQTAYARAWYHAEHTGGERMTLTAPAQLRVPDLHRGQKKRPPQKRRASPQQEVQQHD